VVVERGELWWVITIDKGFLTERVGRLPAHLFEREEDGLRLVLAL